MYGRVETCLVDYVISEMSETGVKLMCDCFAVEILSDEHEFDHAVTIMLVPVAHHVGILLHYHHEVFLRGSRIPLSGRGQLFLHTCLLKEVGHFGTLLEV